MNVDVELLTDILLWKHNLLMNDLYECVVDGYKFAEKNDIYDYETLVIHYRFRNLSDGGDFVDDVYIMDVQDYKNLQRQKKFKELDI